MVELHKLSYSDDLSLYALSTEQSKLSKVLIAVQGVWHGHINGSFEMTTTIMQQMVENFDKQLIDVVCDYEHQTLTKDKAPASGWIKSLVIEDDNLYANVEWTDQAKEEIKTKQYRYVSPVYDPMTIDPKSGNDLGWSIHSLSLTNRPFLEELGEVIANNNKSYISLKAKNDKLSEQLKKANDTIESYKKDNIELIVNNAIKDGKLNSNQKEYALKQAKEDLEGFKSFLDHNPMHPFAFDRPMFENDHNGFKSNSSSDIDDMVAVASKVNG